MNHKGKSDTVNVRKPVPDKGSRSPPTDLPYF